MSDFDSLKISERDGAVRFAVRVQPRSSREGIDGVHGDALRIRVNAPPVDGAANEAVVELLAKAIGISKRSIQIVGGATSRSKLLELRGLTPAQLRNCLTQGNRQ